MENEMFYPDKSFIDSLSAGEKFIFVKVICGLVAIDRQVTREELLYLKELALKYDITADCAEDGYTAVKLAESKHYDLIFMDQMMPGIDGPETMRMMRDCDLVDGSTKIVLLTANAIVGVKEAAIADGFDAYLAKPVDINELESTMLSLIPDELIKITDKKYDTGAVL